MKPSKIIVIFLSCLIGSELVMYLVHQVLLGYPYLEYFVMIPIFFAIFEVFFCFMGYKSYKHGKNTRWFVAFKMVKMLFAVLFVAAYLMMTKTGGEYSGFLIRFFAEYMVFLGAETYIGTQSQIKENQKQ